MTSHRGRRSFSDFCLYWTWHLKAKCLEQGLEEVLTVVKRCENARVALQRDCVSRCTGTYLGENPASLQASYNMTFLKTLLVWMWYLPHILGYGCGGRHWSQLVNQCSFPYVSSHPVEPALEKFSFPCNEWTNVGYIGHH